jgi:hypothetical protein
MKKLKIGYLAILVLSLFACNRDEALEPTSVSGTAFLSDGTPLSNHIIRVEGLRSVVCPPIVYCDGEDTMSRDSALTDEEGQFSITIEPYEEVDYYSVYIDGVFPGTNQCATISQSITPGSMVADLNLFISCE